MGKKHKRHELCVYLVQRSMVPMHIMSWAPHKPHPRTHWTNQTHRIDANCAVLDVSLNVTLHVTVLWLCWTNGTASSYMIKLVNLLLVVEISTIDNSNCIGPFPWVFSFSSIPISFCNWTFRAEVNIYAHCCFCTHFHPHFIQPTEYRFWKMIYYSFRRIRSASACISNCYIEWYVLCGCTSFTAFSTPNEENKKKKEVQVRNREIVTMNWNRMAKTENLWDAVQCDAVVSIL